MREKIEILESHIDDVEFTILDVETTGLNPNYGDRVCELAAVKICSGAIIETFQTLINPQRPLSYGAFLVNKISPDMVADAPTFPAIADNFHKFIKGSVIAAYNSPFDISFLEMEFRLSGISAINNYTIDILKLSRQLLPGLKKYRQEDVALALNLDFPIKHRALEDVLITSKIFNIIISILKAYEINQLKDLLSVDLPNQLSKIRIELMKNAIHNKLNLWIKYFSPFHREITEQILTPYKISGDHKNNYLEAFSHTSKTTGVFSIAGLMDIKIIKK